MLETTLASEFTPGSNLKGDVAGANWSFLLPSLELDSALCVGAPSLPALRTLARAARRVLVTEADRGRRRALREALVGAALPNVWLLASSARRLPVADGTLHLIALASAAGPRTAPDAALRAELRRALHPRGTLYVETPAAGSIPDGRALRLRVGPAFGEVRTALALEDPEVQRWFERAGLEAPLFQRRPLRALERGLLRAPLRRLRPRHAALLGSRIEPGPPRYLVDAARAGGLELGGFRWALSAQGLYSSRKVLFFLFGPGDDEPRYLVKLTRDPVFNRRLENEYEALRFLEHRPLAEGGTLPKALFLAHHGGLAIVGETALAGTPLRARLGDAQTCPWTRAAVDWLRGLACATAERATPAELAAGLEPLLRRFDELYPLEAGERALLGALLDDLARLSGPLATVFQHGDPGVWNLLATRERSVAFLDWEAAERRGLPLWDHFYFLRSCAMSAPSRGLRRRRLARLERELLSPAPTAELLVRSTREYCRALALPGAAVGPLFFYCWLHRALKEATRLPAGRLAEGHYFGLLRLCLARRGSPVLARLLAGSA